MINECSDGAANDFDISISTEKESNTEEREKKAGNSASLAYPFVYTGDNGGEKSAQNQ
jgi:hypothetical protein